MTLTTKSFEPMNHDPARDARIAAVRQAMGARARAALEDAASDEFFDPAELLQFVLREGIDYIFSRTTTINMIKLPILGRGRVISICNSNTGESDARVFATLAKITLSQIGLARLQRILAERIFNENSVRLPTAAVQIANANLDTSIDVTALAECIALQVGANGFSVNIEPCAPRKINRCAVRQTQFRATVQVGDQRLFVPATSSNQTVLKRFALTYALGRILQN